MAVKVKQTNFMHKMPKDMSAVIKSHKDVFDAWNKLTPLARNEWICWVTIVKKSETRTEHLKRLSENLRKAKRRPCCWPGCPHRKPNTLKYFSRKKTKQ